MDNLHSPHTYLYFPNVFFADLYTSLNLMFTHCSPKSIVTKQQINSYFLLRNSPIRAQAASMLSFLHHTQLDTHTHTKPAGLLWTSFQPAAEAATCTTHNEHERRTSMPSVGFEPAMSAVKQLRTYDFELQEHRYRWTATYRQLNIHHTYKQTKQNLQLFYSQV